MAKIKIQFRCGCSFSTSDPVKATKHCDAYNHSMTITGEVVKTETRKKKVRLGGSEAMVCITV